MGEQNTPEGAIPEQIQLLRQIAALAEQRTALAIDGSRHRRGDMVQQPDGSTEQSSVRSYLSAERTLSVWVRTALALMVFGLAIDRFGLILGELSSSSTRLHTPVLYTSIGSLLVAFGILMVVTTGLRFLAYARTYRAHHDVPYRHGPFLAPLFALLVALFGAGLLALMLVLAA